MPKLHPSHDSAKCKICNQVPQSLNKLINCINIFSELTLSILYVTGIDIKKQKFSFTSCKKTLMTSFATQYNIKYYSPYFWIGQHVLKAVQTLKKKFYYYLFNFCFVSLFFCICDLSTKSSRL